MNLLKIFIYAQNIRYYVLMNKNMLKNSDFRSSKKKDLLDKENGSSRTNWPIWTILLTGIQISGIGAKANT